MAEEPSEEQLNWPKETIPINNRVFCRVHKDCIKTKLKRPKSIAFRNTPIQSESLSSDWEKYSTSTETRERIKYTPHPITGKMKDPNNYFVISLIKGEIESNIPGQIVEHTPDIQMQNQAHSDIIGIKDHECRLKMLDLYQWEISPNWGI